MKRNYGRKILLVSHEMSYTGAPRSLLNMALVLQNLGNTVYVWTLVDGTFRQEFEKKGMYVTQLFPNQIQMRENEIKHYDLVILNTVFCACLVGYFQSITRTILYIREAGNIPDILKDCGINKENICCADEAVCVSEYAKKYIKDYCMPHHLNVLNNYIKDNYHGYLNLVSGGIIHFLISGTLEERKGQDVAMAAFQRMPQELKKITRLHIVGRKPEWSRYYWEEIKSQYDERIIDHGEISDDGERWNLYRKMNVFIIASRDDACSLVALEGAMLGKALIMSENVGAQYLDKRKKGVYPTGDVDALCRKMCGLTSRKELLLQGIEMRRMYERTSTERIYKRQLLKIIEKR